MGRFLEVLFIRSRRNNVVMDVEDNEVCVIHSSCWGGRMEEVKKEDNEMTGL
jgi:hypothetical protein